MGDSFMITFVTLKEAIDFSVKLNNYLIKTPIFLNNTKKDKIILRTGISYGLVNKVFNTIQGCKMIDFYGNVVNTASRMESHVSKPYGISIGFINETESNVNKIFMHLKKFKQYNINYLEYKNTCNQTKHKRSSKLLHDLNYTCININKLKGIKQVKVLDLVYNNN